MIVLAFTLSLWFTDHGVTTRHDWSYPIKTEASCREWGEAWRGPGIRYRCARITP